jgi:toxin ParE1/3/4
VRLVLSGTARRDLAEAIAFIAADNPHAADRQNRLIQATAHRPTRFPALGRAEVEGRRVAQVATTPFRLVYEVRRDSILILRVWHGARAWPSDPR